MPVDVRGRLLERAEDTDSLVGDEVPALLAEVGGADLDNDLARLAKNGVRLRAPLTPFGPSCTVSAARL